VKGSSPVRQRKAITANAYTSVRSSTAALRTCSGAGLARFKWNEIVVVGRRGDAYVNNIGFDFGGELAATVAVARP